MDRVLARAHSLEVGGGGPDDGIEPNALIAAAAEVGIDRNAVRDSLAIERFSITDQPVRRFDRVAGSAAVMVEREMRLDVGVVVSGIETWLSSVHRLTCDRRADGTLFARRRSDLTADVGRMVASVRGDGRLDARAVVVEAVPQTVGSTPGRPRTIVRVSADRSAARQARLVGGGTIAGAGVGFGTGAVVAAETLLAFPAIAVPLAIGGYATARSGRNHADRLELELERLLSRVERGEKPTGLLGRMARRAKRAAGTVR